MRACAGTYDAGATCSLSQLIGSTLALQYMRAGVFRFSIMQLSCLVESREQPYGVYSKGAQSFKLTVGVLVRATFARWQETNYQRQSVYGPRSIRGGGNRYESDIAQEPVWEATNFYERRASYIFSSPLCPGLLGMKVG